MKLIRIIIVISMPIICYSQYDDLYEERLKDNSKVILSIQYDNQGRVVFDQVFDSLNQSKTNLIVKSHVWMSELFKSSNDAIQMYDKEMGIIIGKGNISIQGFSDKITFTIKIETKNSKAKVQIYNLELNFSNSYGEGGGILRNYISDEKIIGVKSKKKRQKHIKLRNHIVIKFDQIINDFGQFLISKNENEW